MLLGFLTEHPIHLKNNGKTPPYIFVPFNTNVRCGNNKLFKTGLTESEKKFDDTEGSGTSQNWKCIPSNGDAWRVRITSKKKREDLMRPLNKSLLDLSTILAAIECA